MDKNRLNRIVYDGLSLTIQFQQQIRIYFDLEC